MCFVCLICLERAGRQGVACMQTGQQVFPHSCILFWPRNEALNEVESVISLLMCQVWPPSKHLHPILGSPTFQPSFCTKFFGPKFATKHSQNLITSKVPRQSWQTVKKTWQEECRTGSRLFVSPPVWWKKTTPFTSRLTTNNGMMACKGPRTRRYNRLFDAHLVWLIKLTVLTLKMTWGILKKFRAGKTFRLDVTKF